QMDAEFNNIAAVRFARTGDAEKARAELLTVLQKEDSLAQMRAQTLVDVFLGDYEPAVRRIETAIADLPESSDLRYWGAAASYALASHALRDTSPERARECADRAIALLRKRIEVPYGLLYANFRQELLMSWAFAPLRAHP